MCLCVCVCVCVCVLGFSEGIDSHVSPPYFFFSIFAIILLIKCFDLKFRNMLSKIQKQSSSGVLRKRCSENMQQIYRRILRHGCSPINLLHIFRRPLTQNISGRLLLKITISPLYYSISVLKILLPIFLFFNFLSVLRNLILVKVLMTLCCQIIVRVLLPTTLKEQNHLKRN